MRLPGVRGDCRRAQHSETFEMSALSDSNLLQHGSRRTAPRRSRESLRRAAADLRLPGVREASTNQDQVLGVSRGGVLRREAQAEAQDGARERVSGAVRISLKKTF